MIDHWIRMATFQQSELLEFDNKSNREEFDRIKDITNEKITFTGACGYRSDKTIIAENELLLGEIGACTIKLDRYEIRSAARLYTDNNPTFFSRKDNKPAPKKLIEYAMETEKNAVFGLPWSGYRLVHEISTRYIGDNDGNSFIPLAAACQGFAWSEYITFIGTGKIESGPYKDTHVLFVHKRWIGSSFGSDYWYAMMPDETIKEYKQHDMDDQSERTHWKI